MNDLYTNELKKLYDDKKVSPFVQEVIEYYATKEDYSDESFTEGIEPPDIVEPVYMLFLLQRREAILDELSYVRKRYPSLFTCVAELYENILVHMDMRPLESENAHKLFLAMNEKVTSAEIFEKVEAFADGTDDIMEALDKFYTFLHSLN